MSDDLRPYRSVLYIPGSKDRALEKARGLAADAIIFDLEDAVTPDAKTAARNTLLEALEQGGYGNRARIVRINALDTPWGRGDAEALRAAPLDAVLLPKVDGPEQIDALAEHLEADTPIWAMMETPRGILNALAIADHPRVAGLVAGTNDLVKELGCHVPADRGPLQMSLQSIVLAARAGGCRAIDGVYNAFKDEAGLEAECRQGRALGFDGKTLIHPAQLDVTNRVFAPTEEEIALARRQIEAFEQTEAAGQGVAVVDGKIVENLHVESARRLLAQARAIEAA